MGTNIEWSDETWNPTTGCDRISAGCDNCYALTMSRRLKAMGSPKYQNDGDARTSGPGFGLTTHPGSLQDPYGWSGSRKVFVDSMSDLFHARVPLSFVQQVIEVIADTPQHTYQILTKRASRLPKIADKLDWPANLWLGVSVENAAEAHRIDDLRAVPAAVRFLSCEPLLGPLGDIDLTGIGWVIAGGESGAGARPMHPGWARSLLRQCQDGGVPFFMKQFGAWRPLRRDEIAPPARRQHRMLHHPGGRDEYQVLVREGGHNGDPDGWPADLRVRKFPQLRDAAA